MAELTEQKKTMSDYIEKAKNRAKNIVDNFALTKKPETDLETKEDNANSVTIAAKVSVNNPYNIEISIIKATYDFFYGDGKKVNGILQDQGKLKAKTENLLDVRVKVPLSSLARPGSDHMADIDYRLGMNITIDIPVIGHVIIPVSGKGKFRRPSTTMSDFLISDQAGQENEIVHEVSQDEVVIQEVSQKRVDFRP
ncbi:hypothetical protein C5167_026674 [Papaver somniferum]|uniref:desiccation protectant protein Lea14 homolog n=1 Tax=Papaver somniferum TaxID=3469 RepID=UPI000E700A71|nr:desiccation protectant protein Lea14 homolog [Papaver somniferum]RZC86004.1 hypothetical protein C5167_026674 [Papaver somniferum]